MAAAGARVRMRPPRPRARRGRRRAPARPSAAFGAPPPSHPRPAPSAPSAPPLESGTTPLPARLVYFFVLIEIDRKEKENCLVLLLIFSIFCDKGSSSPPSTSPCQEREKIRPTAATPSSTHRYHLHHHHHNAADRPLWYGLCLHRPARGRGRAGVRPALSAALGTPLGLQPQCWFLTPRPHRLREPG